MSGNLHPGTLLMPLSRGVEKKILSLAPVAWYDTTDRGYLTIVDTDKISVMKDRSGNGHHTAEQTTSTSRPTWTASQLNGLHMAVFDGGDYLQTTFAESFSQANTIIVVGKYSTAASYLIDGIDVNSRNAIFTVDGTTVSIYAGTQLNDGSLDTVTRLYTAIFNGVSSSYAVSGGTAVTGDAGAHGLTGITIGARFTGISDFLIGGIAEILIFDRALSAAEVLQVELYLANKFGLYHPYATWINSYSAAQQLMIHAAKLNKDSAALTASTIPYIWYDSTNKTFLTLVSTAITQFLDKSGNERDTDTQATSTARPTFTAGQANNFSGAVFDGGDYLILSGVTLAAKTIIIVTENSNTYPIGGTDIDVVFEQLSGGFSIFTANGFVETANPEYTADSFTTPSRFVNGGAVSNEAPLVVDTPYILSVSDPDDSSTAGDIGIGAAPNVAAHLVGSILEILVFDTALSTADLDIWEGLLATKYNITLS